MVKYKHVCTTTIYFMPRKNSLFAFILYLISLVLNGFAVCVSFLGLRIMLKENGML